MSNYRNEIIWNKELTFTLNTSDRLSYHVVTHMLPHACHQSRHGLSHTPLPRSTCTVARTLTKTITCYRALIKNVMETFCTRQNEHERQVEVASYTYLEGLHVDLPCHALKANLSPSGRICLPNAMLHVPRVKLIVLVPLFHCTPDCTVAFIGFLSTIRIGLIMWCVLVMSRTRPSSASHTNLLLFLYPLSLSFSPLPHLSRCPSFFFRVHFFKKNLLTIYLLIYIYIFFTKIF